MLRDPFAALFIVTSLCTDVPHPSEKNREKRRVVSSPDFFSEGGGTSVHKLIVTENRGLKQRRFQETNATRTYSFCIIEHWLYPNFEVNRLYKSKQIW